MHVGDVATAITAVIDAPTGLAAGQVYNVADRASNFQLGEVAARVAAVCGPQVSVSSWPAAEDARDYRVSGDKLTEVCGWRPRRVLDDGVAEIAEALTNGLVATQEVRRAQ